MPIADDETAPNSLTRRTLEVCVDSAAGLLAAVRAGADRIELCSALGLAGLTPPPGLMRLAATLSCPAYAMIRPNPGDYVLTPSDIDVMRGDIDAALEVGLPGVVLGACRPGGELDEEVLGRLIEQADGRGATLHRVFDAAPDMSRALDIAIVLGFERVLTSGGAPGAPQGVDVIAGLVEQSAGRISVMAGAGLNPGNLAEVIRRTGVHEVHGSCGAPFAWPDARRAATLDRVYGGGFSAIRVTDEATVAAMVAILREMD